MMDAKILGERIQGMMKFRGIKRKDMASKLGMSYNSLTKKLNGKREFTYYELYAIKDILNMDMMLCANVMFNSNFEITS